MKVRRILATMGKHTLLVVLSILFAFPFVWLISTPLKPDAEVMRNPPVWIPSHFQFDNFWKAMNFEGDKLGYIPFLVYGRNTVVLCLLTVLGLVISNALVAYGFAKFRFPGRNLFFILTLATMMIPFPVLMVPTFSLFRAMDWVGTYRPLWVPAWFGSGFSIFLLRQFFKTIPNELSEAARIDGASEFAIFFEVVLPLCKPALAVVALFGFMGTWNDFLGPLIYLLDQKQFTLGLGLQAFQSQHGGTPFSLQMAATSIVILPVVILFIFMQRLLVQGIAVTGIK